MSSGSTSLGIPEGCGSAVCGVQGPQDVQDVHAADVHDVHAEHGGSLGSSSMLCPAHCGVPLEAVAEPESSDVAEHERGEV